MLRTLRNLIVSIMAAFIRDRDARHKFRNKYKRKSKFRKLRDDFRRVFIENEKMRNDIQTLRSDLASFRREYSVRLWDFEREQSLFFRVTPLDNSPPKGPSSEVFLAVACVAKNEAVYLKEWIEYHKLLGVDRFYFYDNESDDNTKEILEPYIEDGTVVYHFLPNHPITKKLQHIEAFNDAIFKYRDKARWMALIDVDEFIVPVEKTNIPEFLSDYDQYPAVVINWICFDSNGHDKKPTAHGGLVTANYTRVRKNHNNNDRLVKSIVNPKEVVNYISQHFGLYYHGHEAVNENFQKMRGQYAPFHTSNKIRINHYKTKSREEYLNRVTKNAGGTPLAYKFLEAELNFQEETTEDITIQKYVPQLKKILGIKE